MNKYKKYKFKFKSLLSEKTSEEEYERAITSIEKRVERIWNYICKVSDRDLVWWAFRNDVVSLNGEATNGGTFDPYEDSKFVQINGMFTEIEDSSYPYNKGFPTKLIWDKNWKIKIKNNKNTSKKLIFKDSYLLKKKRNN
jgi:hypothetical protein